MMVLNESPSCFKYEYVAVEYESYRMLHSQIQTLSTAGKYFPASGKDIFYYLEVDCGNFSTPN